MARTKPKTSANVSYEAEYKPVVIGVIFLKCIADVFEERINNGYTEGADNEH